MSTKKECSTYLPLLIPRIPVRALRHSLTRHLRLMGFHILLRERRAHLLVRLVVRFLTVLVAVESRVAFVAGFEG